MIEPSRVAGGEKDWLVKWPKELAEDQRWQGKQPVNYDNAHRERQGDWELWQRLLHLKPLPACSALTSPKEISALQRFDP
jgi:hypothetical protein